jgi:ATP-binding cassette subfamily B protein
VQNADCIYVLRDGKIAEYGKHQELLDNHGEYYRLHHKNRKTTNPEGKK